MKKWICLLGLCLLLMGCSLAPQDASKDRTEESGMMQIGNPLQEVASLEELENQLGYTVPVLDKEITAYIVLAVDDTTSMGCIDYSDGTSFRMQKGSGDISGIYGGTLESDMEIDTVTVSYYTMEDLRYALWEKDGFTYSLVGGASLENDVQPLINA